MFNLSDYTYSLPSELIAETAIHPHHDARLMVIDRTSGHLEAESTFWHLDEFLWDDRVIFLNNSRVLRARIALSDTLYTSPSWESKILSEGEIFYLKTNTPDTFEALVRPGNKFKIGTIFEIWEYKIELIGITDSGRILKINNSQLTINNLLATHGALPLPPYIEYSSEKEADYQTSFAEKDGSVAAPTASLHFTSELMEKIENQKEYITLHVGLGTFKGIDTTDIREYAIHSEVVEVPTEIFATIAELKQSWKRIVAVGTTACRTLESLPSLWRALDTDMQNTIDANIRDYWNNLTRDLEENDWIQDISFSEQDLSSSVTDTDDLCRDGRDDWSISYLLTPISFSTSIYITPGYIFRVVDDLITNFHIPESSLLVLVSAFLGYEATMEIYEQAISGRYRFYSFGDGMYIRWK
jgi:S-adenosylmethionine:tRNA ribosyltransferase-isomerase